MAARSCRARRPGSGRTTPASAACTSRCTETDGCPPGSAASRARPELEGWTSTANTPWLRRSAAPGRASSPTARSTKCTLVRKATKLGGIDGHADLHQSGDLLHPEAARHRADQGLDVENGAQPHAARALAPGGLPGH